MVRQELPSAQGASAGHHHPWILARAAASVARAAKALWKLSPQGLLRATNPLQGSSLEIWANLRQGILLEAAMEMEQPPGKKTLGKPPGDLASGKPLLEMLQGLAKQRANAQQLS